MPTEIVIYYYPESSLWRVLFYKSVWKNDPPISEFEFRSDNTAKMAQLWHILGKRYFLIGHASNQPHLMPIVWRYYHNRIVKR